MKIVKPILVFLVVLSAAVILLPTLSFLVLRFYLLTPDMLKDIVNSELKKQTNIKFDCEEISLDYWTEWPSVSVIIRQGKASLPVDITDEENCSDGIKLGFQRFGGKVDLMRLITDRELLVENLFLDNAEAQIDIRSNLVPIVKTSKRSKKQLQFNVNEIRLTNVDIAVNDSLKSLCWRLNDTNLYLEGNLNKLKPDFRIADFNTMLSVVGDTPLAERMWTLSLKGWCDASEYFHDISAKDVTFYIGQFPFQLEGTINNIGQNETPYIDFNASLLSSELSDLFEYLPETVAKEKKNYNIEGIASCNLELKGNVGKDEFPHAQIKGSVDNGRLFRKDIMQGFDSINMSFKMNYEHSKPDSCYVEIKNLSVSGLDSKIYMNVHVSNYVNNPFVYGDLKGNVDFKRVSTEFLNSVHVHMNGKVNTDLSFAFNLKELKQMNYHRLWAEGIFNTERFETQIDTLGLNIFAKNVDMTIGYKNNRSNFINTAEVLSCDAEVDTLDFVFGDSISFVVSKMLLRANTTLDKDSDAVTPVTAHMKWNRLKGQISQSVALSLQEGELHTGFKPSVINKRNVDGALVLKSDNFRLMDANNKLASQFSDMNLISEFQPSSPVSGKELSLKNWNVKSQLEFSNASLVSSFFPQRLDFNNSRVGIRNNQLLLNRLQISSGDTKLLLSGILSTMGDSLLKRPEIEGDLLLLADNIDFDEFSSLFLSGEAMKYELPDSISVPVTVRDLEQSLSATPLAVSKNKYPLYIPGNLRLRLQLDVDKMVYENAELHQVSGDVEVKDKMAYAELNMRTNMGKAAFNAVYDSRNHENLYTVFDFDLHDVLLAQLQRVVPSVGTMFPLTKSLDGIADIRLTGQTQLDSKMESVLSSAKVAGTLKGQNLTLVDNSTFDEIARKLRFKNKHRNLIDSIEVNFILNESVIEVIPFIIKWDRYKAMAGGTNNLDMMYDYHIDMIDTPVPINFGLDFTGKPNDFHYKIVFKRKYKELFKDDGVELARNTAIRMEEVRDAVLLRMKQIINQYY